MTKFKFETRKGLWVSSSFTEHFGTPEVTPAKTVLPFKTLDKYVSDDEIKSELGVKESTLEDVAALIKKPPEGTKDSWWNTFYVDGLVVAAGWLADSGLWDVVAWRRGERSWRAENRVFSVHFEPMTKISESLSSELPDTLVINGVTYMRI